MSLEKLAIIFLIIIVPIGFVLGIYTRTQTDTLNTQLAYDVKLNNSTYDAVKAYQMNSFNEDYSNLGNVRINNINAAVNTFYSSLSSSLNMSGYSQEFLQNYVPAIVFTMYDGYYIYSKYTNTLDDSEFETEADAKTNGYEYGSTYQNGQLLYGLKPFIHYSCRYKIDSDNDFVITYSLDNYIAIEGIINGKWVNDAGYLLDISPGNFEIGTDALTTHKLKYKGHEIGPEPLMTDYLLLEGKDKAEPYKYHKVNGVKYYYDPEPYKDESGGEKIGSDGNPMHLWFTVANGKKNDTTFKFDTTEDYSAFYYYYDAYTFTQRVLGASTQTDMDGKKCYGLSALKPNQAYDSSTDKYGDFLKQANKDKNIFDIERIDEPDSNFNEHRRAVIRYCIEKNLSVAIANYNTFEGGTANFLMPEFNEEEWDKIQDNMTIITYLQGLPIGTKLYNGVSVIPNATNDEVITEKSIVIVPYENDSDSPTTTTPKNVNDIPNNYYYNIDQKDIVDKYNDMPIVIQPSGILDYDLQKKYIENDSGEKSYYYNKLYYSQYDPTYVNYSADETDDSKGKYKYYGNLLRYIDNNLYDGGYGSDSDKIVTAYYTALGRERYAQYKQNNSPDDTPSKIKEENDEIIPH